MSKLAETTKKLKGELAEAEFPVAWVDGTDAGIVLLHIIQMLRKGTPCLIFPMFWDQKTAKRIYGIVDKLGIRASSFSPVSVACDGKKIESEYQTNVCKIKLSQAYQEQFFEKIVAFSGGVVPAYLWDKTFTALSRKNVRFADDTVYYPLENWTDDDFDAARDFLNMPNSTLSGDANASHNPAQSGL